MSDQELLRDYIKNGSETAFEELVRKHINFVYSAALRMVMDAHLAEDITQKVFLALAKTAPKLQDCTVFSGWLHRTARNIAAMTVRGEVRRRAREKEAALMDHEPSDSKAVWDHLSPLLDDALAELSVNDRDTLFLRYFERLTAKEIGERLGLSEDAAQKRTARAVDQLRRILSGQGVTLSASALAGALGLASVQSAPAALVTSVISSSLTTLVPTATSGIITFMASTNCFLITAALVTAGVVSFSTLQRHRNARLREELALRDAQIMQLQEANKQPLADAIDPNELTALRNEHAELLRLRGEIAVLRRQERERLEKRQSVSAQNLPATSKIADDFVPADKWQEVGADTPQHAFQSFLAVLKTGDPTRIESAIHWDLKWKEDINEEDRQMMDKSKNDYLKMLERAPSKLAAFNLSPMATLSDTDRTRVFFHLLTTEGTQISSSFEMVQLDGQWKPILAMGWHYPKDSSSFFTSPMFGPAIDLERQ